MFRAWLRDLLSHQPLGPMRGLPWQRVGALSSQSVSPSLKLIQYDGSPIHTTEDLKRVPILDMPQVITTGPFRHHIGLVFDPAAPNEAEFLGSGGQVTKARYFTFFTARRADGSFMSRGSVIVPIVPHVRSPAGYEILLTSEIRSHNCVEPHAANPGNALQKKHITWSADGSRVITFPKGIGRSRSPLTLRRGEAFGFPGGTIDPADPNLAAGAIRELLEESGFKTQEPLKARAIRDTNPRRLLNTDAVFTNDTYIVQLPRGTLPPETMDEGNVLRLKTFSPDEMRFLIDIGELDSPHTTIDPWLFFEDVVRRGARMYALGRIQIGYVDLVIPTKTGA